MPTLPLQPPDHPIALRRSHLLSPAPDRMTNTPTTLRITRENTISGRDFSVHQLRHHEEPSSPRRHALLFTVSGRFWSNSQLREIRNANGRPLLELRRIWWKGQWSVRRPGGVGDDLLHAELRWGIGMKMAVRFQNALLSGIWDEDELENLNENLNRGGRSRHRYGNSYSYNSHTRELQLRQRNRRAPDQESIRTLPRYEQPQNQNSTETELEPGHGSPPPYSVVMAEDHAQQSSSGSAGGGSGTESDGSTSTSASASDDESGDEKAFASAPRGREAPPLPSYDSVRRMRRVSSHSLRDLLEAIEPPGEPAPASPSSLSSLSSLSSSRPRSEGGLDPKVGLKLVQQSSSMAVVMMGEKRIIYIRREKVMDFHMPGPIPKWEVEVAEGVDLLLATSVVLIMAEFVKNEYRMRTN
ncbi:hypothetical protein N7478_000416 [Penicillium angulare]|uniref:uncharacterized protein n=1 Tax=Penicillium angulare TaxID=116970 RepID=UPI0025401F9F|nr:uncharacterized protein N7478_000416 [Penicillium angulare]KAJ5291165.1 hypothetical protein N7478_000416 [Penicillium angulare]